MKIAIPVFNDNISPVFDWCRDVVIVETGPEKKELSRRNIELSEPSMTSRLRQLNDMEIDILLCGGISAQLLKLVESHGIQVIPWVSGEMETVLKAYLNDEIFQPCFMMPGRQCRRRGSSRGGRGAGRGAGRGRNRR